MFRARLGLLIAPALVALAMSPLLPKASAAPTPGQLLVSLGDSFTAGEGLDPYGPDWPGWPVCHRSLNSSYPVLAAQSLGIDEQSDACIGAISPDVGRETTMVTGTPNYIAFTDGANDLNLMQAAWGDDASITLAQNRLPGETGVLQSTYSSLRQLYPNAVIFAMAYPDFEPQSPVACLADGAARLAQIHAIIAGLNTAISAAAAATGVIYVDDAHAFAGHEACSADPWVFPPTEGARLHPNAKGQAVMGAALAQTISAHSTPVSPPPTTPPTTPPTSGRTGPITGLAGKCVNVPGASTANGTRVQLFTCNGSGAQTWTVGSDGSIRALGDKCLDVVDNGTADGTPVQIWDCTGGPAQKWTYSADHTLINPQSGKCLDVKDNTSTDGTPLQVWTCFAGDNQRWTLPA
jgi:lysophospholipase L1-like esterase